MSTKCECGFEAKNLAGLKAHKRACDWLRQPVEKRVYFNASQKALELLNESVGASEPLLEEAKLFKEYALRYKELKRYAPEPKRHEQELIAFCPEYRALLEARNEIHDILWGGEELDIQAEHELKKRYNKIVEVLQEAKHASWETAKVSFIKEVHRELPNPHIRQLVLDNETLKKGLTSQKGDK